MKKIQINGVEFNDFGVNNYSNGMHLITCYLMPENMIQDILAGKYCGVYLNPSARCTEEFFGVFGTEEQYKEFKKRQEEAQIASRIIDKAGGFDAFQKLSLEKYYEIETEIRSTYKNWWEE